jgi:hypothetical protein
VAAFRELVEQGLVALARDGTHGHRWESLADAVAQGRMAPDAAADAMLAAVVCAEQGRGDGPVLQE